LRRAVANVFVSHASEDLRFAEQVHAWLADDGHEVFLDRDLRDGIGVGEDWEKRLYERLRWADSVVCVVTSAFAASQWYGRGGDRAVSRKPVAAGAG
jgi:hypothetical protein